MTTTEETADTATARVIEARCRAKSPTTENEDLLAEVLDADGTLRFVAVVDGVTDKSGRSYGTTTGGRLAAQSVARALGTLPADADASSAVSAATAAVADLRRRFAVPDGDATPPAAGFAVLSLARREVWRVGDANVAWTDDGQRVHYAGETELDKAAATVRAVCLHALLEGGRTVEDLLEHDPGRTAIMPMLQLQGRLANRDLPDPLGYGVIDGTPVPRRHIRVFPLPRVACEVVLVTDGYLSAAPTLADAEAELAASLAEDPLRIGVRHRATKAVRPGGSFDDRTFVRVALPAG